MTARALILSLLPVATALPAWSQECDPNYDPCVPVASDVDCAGGSGNGPAYVQGPVTLTIKVCLCSTHLPSYDTAEKFGFGCVQELCLKTLGCAIM